MAGKEKTPKPGAAQPAKAARKAPAKTEKAAEGERIAKVLSRAGISSRREAERLIELGEVAVNGTVITSPALNVRPGDKITVGGQPVAEPEPPRLWLYYKPEGLVTSEADEKGRQTVFESLPEDMPRVMSVGRLDLNSEGLLLLTNDGELKRRLELPSTGWLRKYRVRVNGNPLDTDLEPLRKGIVVEGESFQPMNVTLDRIQGANAWLTVGLREGKNREIRRAMTAIGLTVNRLIRLSYGPFRLNDLKPGEVEEVKARVLRDQLGLGDLEVAEARNPTKPAGKPAGMTRGKPSPRPVRAREEAEARPPRGRDAPENPRGATRIRGGAERGEAGGVTRGGTSRSPSARGGATRGMAAQDDTTRGDASRGAKTRGGATRGAGATRGYSASSTRGAATRGAAAGATPGGAGRPARPGATDGKPSPRGGGTTRGGRGPKPRGGA